MKIPGLPGIGAHNIEKPTRRKFLQIGAAALFPKTPIDISKVLGLSGTPGEAFYSTIKKLPVRFFHYEQWLNGGTGELVTFPDEDKPGIQRKISTELEGYIPVLKNLFGDNSELLRYLDFESSCIEPEVSSYEANKSRGDIDGEFDLLDLLLHFKLPSGNSTEEYYLEVHICPTWDGENGIRHVGDNGIILGKIDSVLGRITDEFELSILDEDKIFSLLRQPIGNLLRDFKLHSWKTSYKSNTKTQRNNNSNQIGNKKAFLPAQYDFTESIKFYDDVVNGRMEITDEVRKKVRKIFS